MAGSQEQGEAKGEECKSECHNVTTFSLCQAAKSQAKPKASIEASARVIGCKLDACLCARRSSMATE